MYRKEHLPFALYVGIKEADFWNMNPRMVKPYNEAYKMKMKHDDQLAWLQGQYVLEALLASVGNMFKKKNAEPHEYPTKPRLEAYEEKHSDPKPLTESEKQKQVENLFLSLRVMQANFNNNHPTLQENLNG